MVKRMSLPSVSIPCQWPTKGDGPAALAEKDVSSMAVITIKAVIFNCLVFIVISSPSSWRLTGIDQHKRINTETWNTRRCLASLLCPPLSDPPPQRLNLLPPRRIPLQQTHTSENKNAKPFRGPRRQLQALIGQHNRQSFCLPVASILNKRQSPLTNSYA